MMCLGISSFTPINVKLYSSLRTDGVCRIVILHSELRDQTAFSHCVFVATLPNSIVVITFRRDTGTGVISGM